MPFEDINNPLNRTLAFGSPVYDDPAGGGKTEALTSPTERKSGPHELDLTEGAIDKKHPELMISRTKRSFNPDEVFRYFGEKFKALRLSGQITELEIVSRDTLDAENTQHHNISQKGPAEAISADPNLKKRKVVLEHMTFETPLDRQGNATYGGVVFTYTATQKMVTDPATQIYLSGVRVEILKNTWPSEPDEEKIRRVFRDTLEFKQESGADIQEALEKIAELV